ncbi:unnamed protein product [Pseudo-nitzschia multistriata]|uniref:Uncharacterized protein n=1 Tax=Pseudo-nitzschia multistriata TaxID=183589 RepID=A0A448Z2E2_9STRA|nr:unnamed protein product [Pseudo-nitzschia multistriata]
MFFAAPHDSFEDGDDQQGPLLPHGSDPRGGNHLLALRRLLYRMERHEILPAGGGAHDGDENDGLWQQQQQQQQQQKLQPWHSLRIRADLCQDLWKAVANDHLESEGSGGGNGDTLRLERAGYLELSERVDRACKRAYLLADRAEEEACSGGVPDLVDQLFGSDGENENVDDEDNDGASEAEGGPQTQEHGDENDFYDEFEDDDGDEEESSKASSPEEPGASQGRKSRRNTTPTASTTQELQKAQREQIEKAIATMARQMKESTQGIHNRLQEQTGTTLDELETVAEQNVADVSRVAETVASHNTRAAGSRWGSLATMVFLVGLFAVTLLTVFAVPKSPDADLSRILFAREADGVTPRSPAVRLLKSALTRVRGLVAGDDDDAYGDDPGEPYDDDERYNELRYEEQREQQRLEKERLEELVRDMKRQKRTARKPPQQEDHRVKEDDDEDEEDDDDDDDGVAEAELPESDAGSPLRDPPQAPKREHQQQQKQQQQEEEEVDPEEEEESDDGDDDDELNGSYDDDDYNEEFEEKDEDGSHEEDEERYKSEEGGDENVEQTIQNQESPKTEPLEEDEETEIEEDEDDDDDYLEDEDEPDNPWGIKPIDDKEELRLQQQQQQQQQHQEREQSTRQQRRQQRRQDKQQRGAEPTRAEVSVDDILASLQQQQQQAPGEPLVSAGGPPSASEKDAPGSGFRRDGIATQQIAPQELRIAAASNDLASLERYLDVAPQHANRQDKRGWTALHYASHHGNLGAVRLLLGHGDGESEWEIDAGIKSFDETPQTAFDVALAVHGIDHPVARAFVESGWHDGGESDERVRRVLDEKKRRDEKDKRLADKAERERLAIQQKRDRMFGDLSRYRAINKNGGDLDDDGENESEVELRRKRLDALLGGEL